MRAILALGPAGTYGHQAATSISKRYGIQQVELLDSHTAIFAKACADAQCLAVIPVENSTEGLVRDSVRDFWLKQAIAPNITVIGEINISISHCLMTRREPMLKVGDITSVLSHPQALGQCSGKLAGLGLIKTVPTLSTAGAAAIVAKEAQYATSAAIASPFAAEIYGLQVHFDNIQDEKGNTTRFHVLGATQHRPTPTACDRTAMILWVYNRPRALMPVLNAISGRNVNLSSIHSLPLGTRGKYAFYIEFDEHSESAKGFGILRDLTPLTERILVLGSYPQENANKI